jgi:hypothetical protein
LNKVVVFGDDHSVHLMMSLLENFRILGSEKTKILYVYRSVRRSGKRRRLPKSLAPIPRLVRKVGRIEPATMATVLVALGQIFAE